MVDFNGTIVAPNELYLNHFNRGLRYGDVLSDTIRVVNGSLIFWEEHYFRLMASMRILRMEIPMHFTLEVLESTFHNLLAANHLREASANLRFTIFRKDGGTFMPQSNHISYIIEADALDAPEYKIKDGVYEVELFKDHYVNADMLSNLNTNNRLINVLGSIYAKENGYDSCLLLNAAKQVVEALEGNLFLAQGKSIKTPSLKEGCTNGIVRKKIMEIIDGSNDYDLMEGAISPFELQKADELFITNTIIGILPVTKYRQKRFESAVSNDLLGKLNALIQA